MCTLRQVHLEELTVATTVESEMSTLCQSAFSTTALLPSVRALLSNKQVNNYFHGIITEIIFSLKLKNFVRGLQTKKLREGLKEGNPSSLPKAGFVLSSPNLDSIAFFK